MSWSDDNQIFIVVSIVIYLIYRFILYEFDRSVIRRQVLVEQNIHLIIILTTRLLLLHLYLRNTIYHITSHCKTIITVPLIHHRQQQQQLSIV